MSEIIFRSLDGPADPLYWPTLELYVETFPRDERGPLSEMAAYASGSPPPGPWRLEVAEKGGVLAGLIFYGVFPSLPAGFLIFIAASQAFRGSGIGKALLQRTAQECLPGPLLWECERPEAARDAQELAVRLRRLEWFRRQGASLLSKGHTQPALAPDREPVPLYILGLPGQDGLNFPTLFPKVMAEAYGMAPDDPCLLEALASHAGLPPDPWPEAPQVS
jgi:GNAT superfamily N-acetyltransferase